MFCSIGCSSVYDAMFCHDRSSSRSPPNIENPHGPSLTEKMVIAMCEEHTDLPPSRAAVWGEVRDGVLFKGWSRYFFVAEHGSLAYHRSEDVTTQAPQGKVSLVAATVQVEEAFADEKGKALVLTPCDAQGRLVNGQALTLVTEDLAMWCRDVLPEQIRVATILAMHMGRTGPALDAWFTKQQQQYEDALTILNRPINARQWSLKDGAAATHETKLRLQGNTGLQWVAEGTVRTLDFAGVQSLVSLERLANLPPKTFYRVVTKTGDDLFFEFVGSVGYIEQFTRAFTQAIHFCELPEYNSPGVSLRDIQPRDEMSVADDGPDGPAAMMAEQGA